VTSRSRKLDVGRELYWNHHFQVPLALLRLLFVFELWPTYCSLHIMPQYGDNNLLLLLLVLLLSREQDKTQPPPHVLTQEWADVRAGVVPRVCRRPCAWRTPSKSFHG
jgi:hypothetical protein